MPPAGRLPRGGAPRRGNRRGNRRGKRRATCATRDAPPAVLSCPAPPRCAVAGWTRPAGWPPAREREDLA
ncbi:hypothetical protein ISF6_2872 [Piscinibacter sakaiensis]|uniref:Uncharacterized protein n=1 Tax=Piscinibacter sakaiensis TaxID=1547922 RepID=A0A0K8P2W0_PISS1|nr:hypothetical protein ISF6_2872 [Piscinibacter sakaiensis]